MACKAGNTNAALVILKHLNSENRALEVLQEIKTTLSIETGTFRELFKPGLRMAMIVGGVLALFCQITGINAIIYFAPEIFKSVGFASRLCSFPNPDYRNC
ncbi:MAG: MFS transporter [Segetibacter sp.]